jgi:hypothetical protein
MELVNATRMVAGYTLGLEPDGRERLVVVAKGTFVFPPQDSELHLADEQLALVFADEFYGEPGLSPMRRESEFAPVKPRCDVLVLGSAHAPGGRPTDRVRVGLRVGRFVKGFDVVGERVWDGGGPTPPRPFVQQPIHYGVAYGGVDVDPDQPERQETYTPNPVGVGYYPLSRGTALAGKPLPNTEEIGSAAPAPDGQYRPMAFGPVGRNFDPRFRLAGTYDQRWMDETFPFLPADFNPQYFQSAPADQQIDHPIGGEDVNLLNLTPEGRTNFRLPLGEVPVEFSTATYERHEVVAILDTIVIEPDERRVTLAWRASHPLRRNILEMRQVVVGRMSSGWYRARALGKTFYPSIATIPRNGSGAVATEVG